MQEMVVERLEETVGTTVRDILDKNIFSVVSWTGNDASLTQIFTAVGKKVKDEKITGKYFHPIAREVSRNILLRIRSALRGILCIRLK